MEELKKKANPLYKELGELETVIKNGNGKLETCIVLLDRLCTLKESQQLSDDSFRNSWMNANARKFRVSVIAIMLTGSVLYLDVLKLDESSVIVASVINLLNTIKGLL